MKIGLKHLVRIEEIFATGKEYTKSELRDMLRINYNVLQDVLSYLLNKGAIVQNEKDGKVYYKWQANTLNNGPTCMKLKKSSAARPIISISKPLKDKHTKSASK